MQKYEIWYHKDMGYCVCIRNGYFWQQCSKYYTSIPMLMRYWVKPRGLESVHPFCQYRK